jgi:trimeric autotransporter adhesin
VVPGILSTFAISPSPTTGGNIAVGKVVATAAQLSQTAVNLSIVSGASAIASMPSTVHIQQGGTNVSFQIVTAAVTTSTAVTVSASVGPDTLLASFNVVPNTTTQAVPSSVTFLANPLLGGGTTTGVVKVVSAVSTATTVNLAVKSGAAGISSLPATVTVPANATSATFPVTTANVASNTPVQIEASTSAGSATATLTVEAPAPVTVQFLTSPVIGGNSTQVRVIMQQTVLAATTVNLAVVSGASAVKSIPASVSVSPGHNTVVFTMSTNAVSTATTVSIKASANGGSATGNETVNP